MKIEISIEKDGEGEKPEMGEDKEVELTPEQIAALAKKLKGNAALSRRERTMLADVLLKEEMDD